MIWFWKLVTLFMPKQVPLDAKVKALMLTRCERGRYGR